jgi:transposase
MAAITVAGIDVGKLYLDVGIAPAGKRFRVHNDNRGIHSLVARVSAAAVQRVVLEAIGPYARKVVAALRTAGIEVGLVNPRRIKAFRDAEGRRAKTDRLDADLIARFALKMTDALRPLPTNSQQSLKDLASRRRQLVEMIVMEKTRLKQSVDTFLCDSIRSIIATLAAERKRIEAAIKEALAADPELTRRYAILVSIPGIGPQVATTLITDLPELGTTDRRAIASLAGVAPHPSQSGTSPGRNQIAGGRSCVRTALYMAGMVAGRSNPKFKADYRALRDNGKPGKVAIIAVARKLLVLANTLVRFNETFDKDYDSNRSA